MKDLKDQARATGLQQAVEQLNACLKAAHTSGIMVQLQVDEIFSYAVTFPRLEVKVNVFRPL